MYVHLVVESVLHHLIQYSTLYTIAHYVIGSSPYVMAIRVSLSRQHVLRTHRRSVCYRLALWTQTTIIELNRTSETLRRKDKKVVQIGPSLGLISACVLAVCDVLLVLLSKEKKSLDASSGRTTEGQLERERTLHLSQPEQAEGQDYSEHASSDKRR